jgi:hypothetical protein
MFDVVLHVLHVTPFLRLFRLQFVFLFDPLDSTRRCVTTIFQRASTLFHTNNVFPRQTSQFQLAVQVPHRYRHQLIVGNVQDWPRRKGRLKYAPIRITRQILRLEHLPKTFCPICAVLAAFVSPYLLNSRKCVLNEDQLLQNMQVIPFDDKFQIAPPT